MEKRRPGRPVGSKTRRRIEADPDQTGKNLEAEDILEPEVDEGLARERAHGTLRQILESPQVAKWFAEGKPNAFIAAKVGCSISSVRNVRVASGNIAAHLASFQHRALNHIEHRSLDDENLKDLMVSVAVAIDKERLIRGEATSRTEIYGKGAVESIKVAVFGLPRPQPRLVGAGETRDTLPSRAIEAGDVEGGPGDPSILERPETGEAD